MLKLYMPKLKDYWYEEKLQSDKDTMSYNAGYDVNYYGYHYDTGCIDFPKEKWEETFNKRKNKFFAYLQDGDEFVGYVNYHKCGDRYECGIVIEDSKRNKGYAKEGLILLCNKAKEDGVDALYDNFEKDRNGIKVFEEVGFKVIEETSWTKFHKEVQGVIVKRDLW